MRSVPSRTGYSNDEPTVDDKDLELAETLQTNCVARATGQDCSEHDYRTARHRFLDDPRYRHLLPRYVRSCIGLEQFWSYIQPKFAHYKERRAHIYETFEPLFARLQDRSGLVDSSASDRFEDFSADGIAVIWRRAQERLESDPEGAITVARTLLESTCKHVLDDRSVQYPPSCDLPDLYRRVSRELNLSPDQHSEAVFKQILGGCASVVNGLASMRNKLSDAHGKGRISARPATRHAAFAVNLAGSLCLFLVETAEAQR